MNTRIFFYCILAFIIILFSIGAFAEIEEEPPPFTCNAEPMGSFNGVPGMICR